MAHFFSYDKCKHKHNVYVVEIKNEKNETVGFRPLVKRYPKDGGLVEDISENYPQLKWKVFSTETLAYSFAVDFFVSLK